MHVRNADVIFTPLSISWVQIIIRIIINLLFIQQKSTYVS